MKPRVLQLFASGINCDRELRHAFERAGAEVEERHVAELREQPQRVAACDLFAIPGGFTYGDDLGAGRVLALEMERYLGDALRALHERGGRIFGVCNGFQALVKMGMLPGVDGVRMSLTWNASHRFECRWSRLRAEEPLAHLLAPGTLLPACTAHAEGRVVFADEDAGLARLERAGCIALRYCDEHGAVTGRYPDCPNGSAGAVAGLVSPSGRILGMMPHPERNLSPRHLPDRGAGAWGRGDEAVAFFRALLHHDPARVPG